MKTVQEYCQEQSWSISELARQAGLSWQAAAKAFYGDEVQYKTKYAIVKALGKSTGHVVQVSEVQWISESEGH